MLETGVWPKNTYADGLPVPAGTVRWAILDTEHENCSISLVDMIEENYNDFIRALLQNNIKAMNVYMNRVALTTFSYFDTGKKPSDEEP